jgi:hypothetical protein
MKVYLLVVSFVILFNIKSIGQDSTSTILKRTYLQVGSSKMIALPEGIAGNASFIRESNKLMYALRFSSTYFEDPAYYHRGILNKVDVYRTINEFNFSIGSIKNIDKEFALVLSSGPAIINYLEPQNIRARPSDKLFGVLGKTYYDYDVKSYYLIGWSFRLESNFYLSRLFGTSVGLHFNYNKQVPNGGFNVSFLFGKLKNKGNKMNN